MKQPAIAQYETDRTQPTPETLASISVHTGFPTSFFTDQRPTPEFPYGSLLFRSHKAVSQKRRKQAHRLGGIVFEGVARLAEKAPPAASRLPRLDGSDPIHAAAVTRSALGLQPDAPIANLLNVLERGGVIVIPLPLEAEPEDLPTGRGGRLDAYSLWADALTRPVIVYMRGLMGDRLRLSVAHELGHLVMHQAPHDDDIEREAFLFAGAFLIPEEVMRAQLSSPVTITDLARMKSTWGMSMQAVAVYANRIGMISERQLKYIYMQLSRRGWRTREPENLDVPNEKPRALRKMAEVIYGEQFTVPRIAADLNLPPGLIRDVIAGYASREELPRVPAPPQQEAPPNNVVPFRSRPS